jgi:hypothetical protein
MTSSELGDFPEKRVRWAIATPELLNSAKWLGRIDVLRNRENLRNRYPKSRQMIPSNPN